MIAVVIKQGCSSPQAAYGGTQLQTRTCSPVAAAAVKSVVRYECVRIRARVAVISYSTRIAVWHW
jgi:hypothetical protein